ncbi:hypothetical protein niasHT_005764 [Heterodera trifolii]|uniref:Homeobox domain-containing protein n=1 Tax=Heterodera trifolii TaxID=157864 RepID=A0ABD2M5M8_9BILA
MKILSSTLNFSIENLLFKPCTSGPTPTQNVFGTASPIVPIPIYHPFFATRPTTPAKASTATIFTPPSLICKSDNHSASLRCKNDNNNSSQQIGTATTTTTKPSTNYAIQKLIVSATSSGKRKRRHRTIFTECQLYTMEEAFTACQYPDVQMREHLADKLKLREERVEIVNKN